MSMRKFARKVKRSGNSVQVIVSPPKPGYLERQHIRDMQKHSADVGLCMYYLFGLQLHRLYGFGAKRLCRLYEAVDREVKGWSDFKFDKEDLIKQRYDETGVDYRT